MFDVETTGFKKSDRIVEVGFARFEQGVLVATWGSLVNPRMKFPDEVSRVHGIRCCDVVGAPTFAAVIGGIARITRNAWPAAYSAGFDQRFLSTEADRIGLDLDLDTPFLNASVRWLDPLVWVRQLNDGKRGNKLTEACKRFGVPIGTAHRATDDAVAAGHVLLDGLREKLPYVTMHEMLRRQHDYAESQEREREW